MSIYFRVLISYFLQYKVLEISVLQNLLKVIFIICTLPLTNYLNADDKQELAALQLLIEKNIPNINIEAINKSPMAGFYEVLSSGQILYVSADAKYLFSGKLFSIESGIEDLTEQAMANIDMKMAPMRRDKLRAIKIKDMIVFKAAEEKYRITVFTDVDCAYCRKLHQEMGKYNALGITVQYMGFPRAGLGSPSHKKLQTVWCADNKLDAMNKAKIERSFGTNTCDDPIAEHYKLVQPLGLTGTPAIILQSGRYIAGYADADKMLAIIKEDIKLMANSVAKAE